METAKVLLCWGTMWEAYLRAKAPSSFEAMRPKPKGLGYLIVARL